MIRLVFAAIRSDPRATIAPAVVFAGSAYLVALCLGIVESVLQPTTMTLLSAEPGSQVTLIQIAVFLMILGIGLPTVVVVSGVTTTALGQERSSVASWRLMGATPLQVRSVMLARMLVTALVAGAIGASLAPPAVTTALRFLISVTTFDIEIPATPGVASVAAAVVLVIGLALIGGLRPASLATRVPAVEAVRDRREPATSLGPLRWIVLVTTVAIALALAGATASAEPTTSSTLALLCAFAFATVIAAGAPAIVPTLTRRWTGVLGMSWPSWQIARAAAVHRLTSTASAVAPLALVITVLGSYFSCIQTLEAAVGPSARSAVNGQQGLILLVPGAVIGILGAAAVLVAIGRRRAREQAQLTTLGATPSSFVGGFLIEPLIYVVSALLLSLLPIAIVASSFAASLSKSDLPFTPRLDLLVIASCAVAAYTVISLAVTPAALTGIRQNTAAELSREP